MRSCLKAALLGLALSGAVPAAAQDAGTVGLAMGYPAAVGLVVHVSDRLAIRPEIALTERSSTSETTIDAGGGALPQTIRSSVSGWTTVTGISGLIYVGQAEEVRIYAAPRFMYGRATTEADQDSQLSGSRFTSTTYQTSGLFGAQYAPTRRFSVFGELGVAYSSQRSSATSETETSGHTVGTTGGVGVIFYF